MDSFKDLRSFPEIRTSVEEARFTDLIHQIKMRHNNVMPTVHPGSHCAPHSPPHPPHLIHLPFSMRLQVLRHPVQALLVTKKV